MSGMMGQRILRREDGLSSAAPASTWRTSRCPAHSTRRSSGPRTRTRGSPDRRLGGPRAARHAGVHRGGRRAPGVPAPAVPGHRRQDGRPFLARDKVRFAGDIVAVVLTESQPTEPMTPPSSSTSTTSRCPPSSTREAALDGRACSCTRSVGTNVCASHPVEAPTRRSSTAARSSCQRTVWSASGWPPCPLEPRARGRRSGGRAADAWLSTQTPHHDRDGLAGCLGLDAERGARRRPGRRRRVRREGAAVEDVLVRWLARKTGRPVRWTETRSENMVAMHHGRAASARVHDRGQPRRQRAGVSPARRRRTRAPTQARSDPPRLHRA